MTAGRARPHVEALASVVLLILLVTGGCTARTAEVPTPTASAVRRPFTVMTTDRIATADPAAVTDQGSMILVQNVFQRLTSSDPGNAQVAPGVWAYKPDLAQECSFPSRQTFTCTLRPKLTFANGNPITSTDVKFSIDRAIRLAVPGSSASALDSLQRIETPDPMTVRFVLRRYDKQFGWALAGPAASIVDHRVYSPDTVQRRDEPIVGSGPFRVTAFTDTRLVLARFDQYFGRTPAQLARLQILTEPDSAAVEAAMTAHRTDLVWRGLSSAALARLANQIQVSPKRTTRAGFSQQVLPGARIEQLRWDPRSPYRNDAALRRVIAEALQDDRTLDSIVPPQVPGHRSVFAMGGHPDVPISWSELIPLTLGYDPDLPDGKDLANRLRNRLEDTGGMSVRLTADDSRGTGDPDGPGEDHADLLIEDRKAWTPTAISWLQPVIDNPLSSARSTIDSAADRARTADTAIANSALITLQARTAADAVVLPLTQQNEYVYTGPGTTIAATSYGPGWSLGLWGISRQL